MMLKQAHAEVVPQEKNQTESGWHVVAGFTLKSILRHGPCIATGEERSRHMPSNGRQRQGTRKCWLLTLLFSGQ